MQGGSATDDDRELSAFGGLLLAFALAIAVFWGPLLLLLLS